MGVWISSIDLFDKRHFFLTFRKDPSGQEPGGIGPYTWSGTLYPGRRAFIGLHMRALVPGGGKGGVPHET